jgi:hypothetical protein
MAVEFGRITLFGEKMRRSSALRVGFLSVCTVVGLWIATAAFGPALVLRFAKVSPTARDRMQEIYNEEDRAMALVREGIQTAKPMREEERPTMIVRRVACPAPLFLDVEFVYSADGKRRPISVARYFITPWRIYLIGELMKKEPNQSLEPTTTAGTSAAEQPLVPAAGVAHL